MFIFIFKTIEMLELLVDEGVSNKDEEEFYVNNIDSGECRVKNVKIKNINYR